MTQPRMNVFGFPHKGLRNALSQLSLLAGNTDYNNQESLNQLKSLNAEVVTMLEFHANAEESIILPALEAKVPGSTTENVEEHEQLEKEVEALIELMKSVSISSPLGFADKFYHSVTDFQSKYIAHMAMEEGEINPLIWTNFTDEELMGQHATHAASLSPDQIMMWYKYIVPALNSAERLIIMSVFKTNASTELFDGVFTMLKAHLSEEGHTQLEAILR